MKLNTDKCHVLLNNQEPYTIRVGNLCIKHSSCEKMFRLDFDCKQKFTNHIDEICKRAPQKLNGLTRIACMGIGKQRTVMNSSFK